MHLNNSESKILSNILEPDEKIISETNANHMDPDKVKFNNFEKLKYKMELLRDKVYNILNEVFTFVSHIKENIEKSDLIENVSLKRNLFLVSKTTESGDNDQSHSNTNNEFKFPDFFELK